MSQVNTNAIYDASGGQSAKLYGVSMRNGGTGWVNRIINGDMRIDQRNSGASVTPIAPGLTYTVDRWGFFNSTSTNRFSAQQNAGSVTPPAGFTNYLGLTVTSAYTPSGSNEQFLSQQIEGLNVADLGWGTANAQAVTASFWVRSSLTGTHSGSVRNPNGYSRSYPFTFTVNAANTWEQKTVTIPGDTGGTWNTNNSAGIQFGFNLGSGSSSLGTAGAWSTTNAFTGATGSVQVSATSGATFYITGVQLEAGSVASPFERRDYGRELMLCQRYYMKTTTTIGVEGVALAGVSIAYCQQYVFPSTMRVSPTCTSNGFADIMNMNGNNIVDISPESVSLRGTTFSGVGSPSKAAGYWDAGIQFSAEL
jgi:hypothetical protein